MIQSRTSVFTDGEGKELLEEDLRFFPLIVNDGDIRQYIAGHIPSHWHKELEIFVLHKGSVRIGIGDCFYTLQAGEGCFINAEVIHSFTAEAPGSCAFRSFVFGPDVVGGMPGSVFDTAYVRPLVESGVPFLEFREEDGDGLYFEQFRRAFQACAEECYGFEFQVREALSNILLHVKAKSRTGAARAVASAQEARLKDMLLWIDGHFREGASVSDIAGAANICVRECQRIFRQYLHYSPMEYVQRKRIFAAAKQLADTDGSVTDIALGCGFSNSSYFCKLFKALMGSTPGKYREGVQASLSGQAGTAKGLAKDLSSS